jgi:hypothetical protein
VPLALPCNGSIGAEAAEAVDDFECDGDIKPVWEPNERVFLRITHINPGRHVVQHKRVFEGRNLSSSSAEFCFTPLSTLSGSSGGSSYIVSSSPKSSGSAVMANLHLHVADVMDAKLDLHSWKRGAMCYVLEDNTDACCRDVTTALVKGSCWTAASAKTFSSASDLAALEGLRIQGYVECREGDKEKWYLRPEARKVMCFGSTLLHPISVCAPREGSDPRAVLSLTEFELLWYLHESGWSWQPYPRSKKLRDKVRPLAIDIDKGEGGDVAVVERVYFSVSSFSPHVNASYMRTLLAFEHQSHLYAERRIKSIEHFREASYYTKLVAVLHKDARELRSLADATADEQLEFGQDGSITTDDLLDLFDELGMNGNLAADSPSEDGREGGDIEQSDGVDFEEGGCGDNSDEGSVYGATNTIPPPPRGVEPDPVESEPSDHDVVMKDVWESDDSDPPLPENPLAPGSPDPPLPDPPLPDTPLPDHPLPSPPVRPGPGGSADVERRRDDSLKKMKKAKPKKPIDDAAVSAAIDHGLCAGEDDVFRWGDYFTFTYRPSDEGVKIADWQVACPFHRKNIKSGCRRTAQVYDKHDVGSHSRTLCELKTWCCWAPTHNRQRLHKAQPIKEEDIPTAEALEECYPVDLLELPVINDDDLDEIEEFDEEQKFLQDCESRKKKKRKKEKNNKAKGLGHGGNSECDNANRGGGGTKLAKASADVDANGGVEDADGADADGNGSVGSKPLQTSKKPKAKAKSKVIAQPKGKGKGRGRGRGKSRGVSADVAGAAVGANMDKSGERGGVVKTKLSKRVLKRRVALEAASPQQPKRGHGAASSSIDNVGADALGVERISDLPVPSGSMVQVDSEHGGSDDDGSDAESSSSSSSGNEGSESDSSSSESSSSD